MPKQISKHSNAKRFVKQGRHTVLPVVGDTVAEVCLSITRLPTLIFCDQEDNESELQIEQRFTMSRGTTERMLDPATHGSLTPLIELLGVTVTDALAQEDGTLRIAFSNKLQLLVVPSGGYEAWHFQYPRPGRPIGGRGDPLALHGTDGRLV